MRDDLLAPAIVKLFTEERLYAETLLGMDRYYSNRVPTAGVCIKNKVELHVNPEFFQSLTLDEQVAVLKHECQHIMFDHIPRFKKLAPEVFEKSQAKDGLGKVVDDIVSGSKFKLLNIAADCSINCNLPGIIAEGIQPKQFDLPDGELMEWYLENLKNNDKAKNLTHFDDHSLWTESTGDGDLLKEKIKQHINAAAQRTRAAGKMTASDELLVDKLNYKARDWKSELKRFVAKSAEILIDTSKKRRNRRYGVQYPGTIKVERLHIGVAIDTSGSVPDDALHQFMAEIGNIAKYAVVTVVEADSEVKNSYVFDPRKQYKMAGRGGTAYQPALDYFTKETEIDGLIYFGDMDAYDNESIKKPKYPVLWAIFGNQDPPVDWGSRTKVEIKQSE